MMLRWREHPLSFGACRTWGLLADMSLPGTRPGTLPRKSPGPSEHSARKGLCHGPGSQQHREPGPDRAAGAPGFPEVSF